MERLPARVAPEGSEGRDDSAVTTAAGDGPEHGVRRRHRMDGPGHTWRSGGSSVTGWDWELVGWAVLLLGAGILLSALAERTLDGALGAILATLALWAGMIAAIVLAFLRSRPRRLLRLRPIDLLYGLGFGVLLRLAAGYLEIAGTGAAPWPSILRAEGTLPPGFWFDAVFAPVVLAPAIEEFFFRAVLLVAIFSAVRRMTNSRAWATFASVVATTLLFVGVHLVFESYTWWSVASIALVGLVCGLLVATSARIWGALLAHVVFNGLWVAMLLVGIALS